MSLVLIIDDEEALVRSLSFALRGEGYEVQGVHTGADGVAAAAKLAPSIVMLDLRLPDMSGQEVLDILRRKHPHLPVVMISGHGNIETAVEAIKVGAYDFIEKPFQTDRLLIIVERAIEAATLRRENKELRLRAGSAAPVTELVGNSPFVQQVRQALDKVSPTNSRVLITGPAGSGKEVVARIIHNRSRRAEGPFVVLNCAAMHPDRMEIELFGTEHGETPDAPRKIGTFELAHGGTLLLDEVADMPLETQGKIVRVLQDQTFERVGGSQRVEVDVRVIATTNRDVQSEMAAGRLREDLYYRLNVVPFRVPSLRDRKEDIPALARHFMQLAAQAAGTQPRQLGEDALAALQAYDWPGNVRQLRNVIDWVLIMAPGDASEPVRADMLPGEISAITPAVLRWEKSSEIMTLPLREARELFEREYLLAQVNRFAGNISRTAAFVGMERSALHRKLKLLGVNTDEKGRG